MSFDLQIINNDLVINNGALGLVQDSQKLIQDILKMCLTDAGTNPMFPWYGSFLTKSIIGTALDTSILVQIGKSQLTTSLQNLKNLQEAQVKSLQRMSADEQIGTISDISIIRNQIDPRLFVVVVKVITKGLKPITTKFNVSTI